MAVTGLLADTHMQIWRLVSSSALPWEHQPVVQ